MLLCCCTTVKAEWIRQESVAVLMLFLTAGVLHAGRTSGNGTRLGSGDFPSPWQLIISPEPTDSSISETQHPPIEQIILLREKRGQLDAFQKRGETGGRTSSLECNEEWFTVWFRRLYV